MAYIFVNCGTLREIDSPANGSFTKDEEGTIFAQGHTIWKLEIPHKDSGFLSNWIVFQNPPTILCRKNQLHEVPARNNRVKTDE